MDDFKLYPAHYRYLQEPSKTKAQHVINYILKDLVLRRVLTASISNTFPTDRSKKVQKYTIISRGPAYEGYEAQSFEEFFIKAFAETDQVQLKPLTNYVLKKFSLPSKFVGKEFYSPLSKAKYLSAIPILKAFGGIKLTKSGKEILAEHQEKSSVLEQGLIDAGEDVQKIAQLIVSSGIQVFFIEESNPDFFKEVASAAFGVLKTGDPTLLPFFEGTLIDLHYFHE